MNAPTLHIYAQHYEHDPAFIVGDRDALTRLRDAITASLEHKCGQADVFTNDGEGYDLVVVLQEDMCNMGLAYVDSTRCLHGDSPYDVAKFDKATCRWRSARLKSEDAP